MCGYTVGCLVHLCFNSMLVRLKDSNRLDSNSADFCFNSMLVRLKVEKDGVCVALEVEFQFHAGAIKRMLGNNYPMFEHEFQFHAGAIKSFNFSV